MLYFGVMKTKTVSEESQGDEIAKGVPTVDDVEKWLTKDLGACIAMLRAIHNDTNLRRLMATHLHGVHMNTIAHNNGIKDVIANAPKGVA